MIWVNYSLAILVNVALVESPARLLLKPWTIHEVDPEPGDAERQVQTKELHRRDQTLRNQYNTSQYTKHLAADHD